MGQKPSTDTERPITAAPVEVESIADAMQVAGACLTWAMTPGTGQIPEGCLVLAADRGDPTDGVVEVRARVRVRLRQAVTK